jgi:DNA repair protein RadC
MKTAYKETPSAHLAKRVSKGGQSERVKIACAGDVWTLLSYLQSEKQEHIVVLVLDARHRVVAQHTAAIGQVDRVQVALADVYRPAIVAGAGAIVLVHNHPSGELTPSAQDNELTSRCATVGNLLGIPVLDHVVVASGGYYSYAENRPQFLIGKTDV